MSPLVRQILSCCWLSAISAGLCAQQLSVDPANPSPLDLVRLKYTHVGCTNADSVRVAQLANRITVQADRLLVTDCGTIAGYFEEYTLGRLPAGDYDAELIVNPPPPTLGPSLLVGSVHFTVIALPPAGSAHPHENYSDMWWNPQESGWALMLQQSAEKLFAVWVVYDPAGRPTWYVLPSGGWSVDTSNALHFLGSVYRTSGPYWGGAFDAAAVGVTVVGSADFHPTSASHAVFSYTIEGVSGTKQVDRFRF